MTAESSIFGFRFGANAGLQPSPEELELFLISRKTDGTRRPHSLDLEEYRGLLDGIVAFEDRRKRGVANSGFGERIYYGVLGHSALFNPYLESAVELYKYHAHTFMALDYRKPASFIAAAEREMAVLDPRNRRDAKKMARLQGMVEDRKKARAELDRRRAVLAQELCDIARFVRDNIVKVSDRCEMAIVVLVQLQIAGEEERRLIEEVKERFRNDLKDALHKGRVSRWDLELAKKDVAILSKELMAYFREDNYAITRLYEAVHDHTQMIARNLDALLGEIEAKKAVSFDDEGRLFQKIEKELVSLVSRFRFPAETAETRSETSRGALLGELRSRMVDHLLALVRKDRRGRSDRRSGRERRILTAPLRRESGKRGGKERRRAKGRRRAGVASQ